MSSRSEQEQEEISAAPSETEAEELDELEPAQIDAPDPREGIEPPAEGAHLQAELLSPAELRAAIEAVLFVADKPVTLDQLCSLTEVERSAVQEALAQLAECRTEGESGIVLQEVAGGWQLRTDASTAPFVRKFLKVKPQRLTRAALETLSIIAYRQPTTRPEVEDVRGVDCGAVIKALLERKLVKILGKKDEIGRPLLYGTTREFLEFFALKDLASLPTLREFQELSQEHQEIVEKDDSERKGPPSVAELADAEFVQRLEAANAESEAVLDELNDAIELADIRSKSASETLNPPPPQNPAQVEPSESAPTHE